MRLLCALLLGPICLNSSALASTKCDYSGADWDSCSTRVSIVLDVDGHPATLHFNSLYYMFRYINEAEAAGTHLGKVESFNMLDYGTIGASAEGYVKGTGDTRPQGWFLWTNHVLPGSSYPYIAAYSDQQKAKEAMNSWGGEIMDAEEMVVELFSFFSGRHGLDEHAPAVPASAPAHDSHGGHGSH
ncbi:hypothetical protein KDL30_04545 [bacterium]|nr:hypothetical protein [bacterium]